MSERATEWNERTERYFRAWSDQLKMTECVHLDNLVWHRRVHFCIGGVGQLSAIAALFTQLSELIATDVSNGLVISSLIVVALVNAAVALLTFYGPLKIAENHGTAASEYNTMWHEIDLMMLRERTERTPFWKFVKLIMEHYEEIATHAPAVPKAQRPGVILSGIGSILSISANEPPPRAEEEAEHHRLPSESTIEAVEQDTARRFAKIHAPQSEIDGSGVATHDSLVEHIERRRRSMAERNAPMRWLNKRVSEAV